MVLCPQGIRADRRFMFIILAPVDEAGFPPTQDSGGVNPVRAMGWTLLFRKRKSRQLRPDIF